MEENYENYSVNYSKIGKQSDLLAVTRLLAVDLMAKPYMKVGDFIKNLSDSDLETLCDVCDRANDDSPDTRFEEIVLISQMLAEAEGVAFDMSLDDIMARTNQMSVFLVIESLHRKGLVKVYHENMSFGEDAGDRIVVEKIGD